MMERHVWHGIMSKKLLEPEPSGVKGYDPHKASAAGDTPGNLKVTSGLSASILIKLMAVIFLIITPLIE
jgi:Na+/H+-translocating membrane pyrophosphatase